MQSIESEGDSIDDAIDTALKRLGVGRERVEIEILADATRGLFGFGAKPARVRAIVRAPLSATPGEDSAAVVSRETRPQNAPRPAPADERTPRSADVHPRTTTASGGATVEKTRQALHELLGHLGVSCQVDVAPSDDPENIVFAITGDSSGLLIGRRGQTLDAIEHIVNRIAGRGEDGAPSRIVIDVERYRERRHEYLDTLARRLADKAKNTRRVITLNPMSPRDRRIVHLALQSDPAIETRSQGEGQFRKILILPVDRARGGSRSKPGQPRPVD